MLFLMGIDALTSPGASAAKGALIHLALPGVDDILDQLHDAPPADRQKILAIALDSFRPGALKRVNGMAQRFAEEGITSREALRQAIARELVATTLTMLEEEGEKHDPRGALQGMHLRLDDIEGEALQGFFGSLKKAAGSVYNAGAGAVKTAANVVSSAAGVVKSVGCGRIAKVATGAVAEVAGKGKGAAVSRGHDGFCDQVDAAQRVAGRIAGGRGRSGSSRAAHDLAYAYLFRRGPSSKRGVDDSAFRHQRWLMAKKRVNEIKQAASMALRSTPGSDSKRRATTALRKALAGIFNMRNEPRDVRDFLGAVFGPKNVNWAYRQFVPGLMRAAKATTTSRARSTRRRPVIPAIVNNPAAVEARGGFVYKLDAWDGLSDSRRQQIINAAIEAVRQFKKKGSNTPLLIGGAAALAIGAAFLYSKNKQASA